MDARDDLYLDRYEGWYSVRDEAYYDESELTGGEGGARLSPQGTPVEWTVEESWFFRLSAYQDRLLALYRDNPDFIRTESRRNEVLRFVEGGLKDLSVSRTGFRSEEHTSDLQSLMRSSYAVFCLKKQTRTDEN